MDELKLYSISDEYIKWLRKDYPNVYSNKIVANARLMYKQKKANDTTAGYVKSALDYQALEKLCDLYEEQK